MLPGGGHSAPERGREAEGPERKGWRGLKATRRKRRGAEGPRKHVAESPWEGAEGPREGGKGPAGNRGRGLPSGGGGGTEGPLKGRGRRPLGGREGRGPVGPR